MLPHSNWTNDDDDDDDDYGQYISDSDDEDDSQPNRHDGGYAESSTSCNAAAMQCFHPSGGGGVDVARTEKQQVLSLTNAGSTHSMTAGSERDDTLRIPSWDQINTAATSALRRQHNSTNDTMSNASWDHFLTPSGKSSNLLMSRIHSCSWLSEKLHSIDLDQTPFSKTTAEGPSPLQNLQTVLRRQLPSRSDLRSASTPALQYGLAATISTDDCNAACIQSSKHQTTTSSGATQPSPLNFLVERTNN